jgi:hypothetical protein
VLQDREDGVANATPELQDRLRGRIGQLRKLGEKPVPVFEETILGQNRNISGSNKIGFQTKYLALALFCGLK